MKKFVAILLCLIILLSLFSCKNKSIEDIDYNSDNDISTSLDTSNDPITNTTNVNYDAVLRVYRCIVDSYPIVNQNPRALAVELGIQGEENIEMFINLYSSVMVFYPGGGESDGESPHYKLGCGYTQKDLNGDGMDELLLLNNEYHIMAVFSYADGKPVLLGNYMPRGSCWIDGEGLLHENESNSADHSTHAIYKIADGGKELELIAEYGTNGHEWIEDVAYTIYYKLVAGEKKTITESEYNVLDEQYGKYLGSVAGAEATKKHSGLTFTSLYTEAEIAMEMYEAAINDEICVIDGHLGEIKLKACRFPSNNSRLDESIIDGKVVFDMDGDGICEYIIRSALMDSLLLHYFNGKVYSFSFCFFNVNTDGSFHWNDSSVTGYYSYGANKLHFDGELLKIEEIYKVVNDGESNVEYYIDGKQVAHNEFLKYIEDNPNTPVEFTSFTAPWQEVISVISLERALEIASEYWYECYNIKAGDVDSETGFPYAFLPKNSNNENYSIALAWLVEGTHYSTLEMIEIDAFTGEIIVPTYEPDGKG